MDYSKAIEIAEGVYWVGYNDEKYGLHSNPYLIVDGEEAVLIDSGSRPDFPTVMMKVLQTGVNPDEIVRLIYQHYDPDLVGSVSSFESVIQGGELEIISQRQNNIFIQHYSTKSVKRCINALGNAWGFRTGRRLKFINTPYAHSPGSFMTYDEKTKTLFSSDIFGAYTKHWELYLQLTDHCAKCKTYQNCPVDEKECFMPGIMSFHKTIMTSTRALQYALNKVKEYDIERIAPQHGCVIEGKVNVQVVLDKLLDMSDIGIDAILDKGDHAIW